LNRAIELPARWDVWLIQDWAAPRYEWFKHPKPPGCLKLLDQGLQTQARDRDMDFTFSALPPINIGQPFLYGTLRGGGSVAGVALQLLYWLKIKQIGLLGVDQWGTLDWHGDRTAPRYMVRAWSSVPILNHEIALLEAAGHTVGSVSDTKLSVACINLSDMV
jgi:hypothetical protein